MGNLKITELRHKKPVSQTINGNRGDDAITGLEVTELRNKPTTSRAAMNSTTTEPQFFHDDDQKFHPHSIFTINQELKIKEWVNAERNGRNIMKPGGRQRICSLIKHEFGIKLKLEQLTKWIRTNLRNDTKDNKKSRQYLTEKHWNIIKNLRKEFPKDAPTATARKFLAAFPNLQMKEGSLRVTISKFNPDNINGPFNEIETNLLLQQFEQHGMNWSKYRIPGRSSESIRQKYATLLRGYVRKMEGKSMEGMMLETIDKLAEDSQLVTRNSWLEKTIDTNNTVSAAIIRFTFPYALARLVQRGKVQQVPPNQYIRRYEEPRQALPKIKYPPRQPLRDPLNQEEEEHVRQLIEECKKLEQNSKVLFIKISYKVSPFNILIQFLLVGMAW